MDIKLLITVFTVVFLAEIGDKTQLATLLFSTNQDSNKWLIFLGSSLALVIASGIGVLAGNSLSQALNPKILANTSGIGFLIIGFFTLYRSAFTAA